MSCMCKCHVTQIQHCEYCCVKNKGIEERLSALEEYLKNSFSAAEAFLVLQKKLDELKANLKEYNEILLGACPIEIEKLNRRRPFCCPVCDGEGEYKVDRYMPGEVYSSLTGNKKCKSCSSSGILWEPEIKGLN